MAGDLETTDIQQFLKSCANERKAIRGLNEVARGLEKRTSVCAFLANDVSEDQYKKLIEALARDANVPLIKVDSAKTLGEWVGLCKYDEDGEATKVVKCGCVAIREWPVMGGEATEKFKAAVVKL
jgi:small subunit ribosomal protein S12e